MKKETGWASPLSTEETPYRSQGLNGQRYSGSGTSQVVGN